MTLMKATYLLHRENKKNKGRHSLAVPHLDLSITLKFIQKMPMPELHAAPALSRLCGIFLYGTIYKGR